MLVSFLIHNDYFLFGGERIFPLCSSFIMRFMVLCYTSIKLRSHEIMQMERGVMGVFGALDWYFKSAGARSINEKRPGAAER